MTKSWNRALSVFLVAMMVISMLPTMAFAADEAHMHDHESEAAGGIELLAEGGTYNFQNWEIAVSASGDTCVPGENSLTVTADGTTTAQLYITNYLSNGAAQGVLSFNWAASNISGLTIDGVAVTASSGSFRKLMAGKATVTVKFTSGSLTVSNFAVKAPQAISSVAFSYDSNMGSVSSDGVAVANGAAKEITVSGSALVAVPAAGSTFLAWTDGENNVLSRDAAFTLIPSEDMTVKAVFANQNSEGHYLAGGSKLFTDLNRAAEFAKSNGNQMVVLLNNTELPSGTYTIPAEVTFLIPFSEQYLLHTDMVTYEPLDYITPDYVKPTEYRSLTLAQGAKLAVYGNLGVAARQSYKSNFNGAPTGPVGFIKMQTGSTITIKDGGQLYAWGYITGSGSVYAESGATVYECFQATDWRGGTASLEMVMNEASAYRVFPLSQYYVQNIEVPLTLEAGAEEVGYMSLTALDQIVGSPIPFIGESGMFYATDGLVTKDYDEANDRLKLTIDGTLDMAPLTISSPITTMNSTRFELPINSNITVEVKNGGSIQVKQNIAFLPGTELIINRGGTCALGAGHEIYVYDLDQWGGYCSSANYKLYPIRYAPGARKTRTEADLKDTMIQINGTLDASAGGLYTTAGGANICSTGNGKIILTKGTKTTTKQVTQNDRTVIPVDIPVTTAKLKNADGTYLETETETYNYANGVWRPD